MTDVYVNPATNGIVIEAGEIKLIDGIEEMEQRIRIALLTHKGEWLFDTDLGLPWADEILVKRPNFDRIRNRVDTYVRSIEGVTDVRDIIVELDSATRVLTIGLEAETTEGITGPFNVVVNLGSPAAR